MAQNPFPHRGGDRLFPRWSISFPLGLVSQTSSCPSRITRPASANTDLLNSLTAGIPSTFNFRRDSTPGWKEIDFIIASRQAEPDKLSHFISAPLFVPSDGATGPLRTLRLFGDDPEIDFELGPDTRMETNSTGKVMSFDPLTVNNIFQENWALTWDGFDPTAKDSTYAINWLPDRIDWYAGRGMKPPLRVSYKMKEKHKDVFPTKGPFPYVQIGHSTLPPSAFLMLMDSLPFMPTSQLIVDSLRIGPWEAGGDWAGEVNWKKYPTPVMKIGKLAVRGCRIQKPVVDP